MTPCRRQWSRQPRLAILDGVANMAAGSVQELADIIGRYVRDSGGTPQASVVGWGYKTSPPAAAFANGVFGHCLDYEIQGFPPTHGTSSCLPAALALGEQHQASGKTIITAYALGWEIQGGYGLHRPPLPPRRTIRRVWWAPWVALLLRPEPLDWTASRP